MHNAAVCLYSTVHFMLQSDVSSVVKWTVQCAPCSAALCTLYTVYIAVSDVSLPWQRSQLVSTCGNCSCKAKCMQWTTGSAGSVWFVSIVFQMLDILLCLVSILPSSSSYKSWIMWQYLLYCLISTLSSVSMCWPSVIATVMIGTDIVWKVQIQFCQKNLLCGQRLVLECNPCAVLMQLVVTGVWGCSLKQNIVKCIVDIKCWPYVTNTQKQIRTQSTNTQ